MSETTTTRVIKKEKASIVVIQSFSYRNKHLVRGIYFDPNMELVDIKTYRDAHPDGTSSVFRLLADRSVSAAFLGPVEVTKHQFRCLEDSLDE